MPRTLGYVLATDKQSIAAGFKRLAGVEKKTFCPLVETVWLHDAKTVRRRVNHLSRRFSLSAEDQVHLTLLYYWAKRGGIR